MTDSAILERVRKLLAKAESTTPEEAEALTAKAHELMLKHAIDEAMLDATRPATAARPTSKIIAYAEGSGYLTAKRQLLHEIAKANRCKAIFADHRQTKRADLIGYPDDIAFVELLYTSLLVQMATAGDTAWLAAKLTGGHLDHYGLPVNARTWKLNFYLGFAVTVRKRLDAQQHHVIAESGERGALVLADRATLVEDAAAEKYPSLRKIHPSYRGDAIGRQAGMRAGSMADLSGGRGTLGHNRRAIGR